ncbi:MAG: hypothetical protein A2622_00620 [Bdellovibrionales bacterium RIFCSPHIGHO2_01_FULL_40_29]|nr:MAG: hypothetical protein A2622_00620 [Bdellovibrionales bacterium RIFCSPHIGHO2_01_FULL_40_29]OFZ32625.1 MAG: hypothetical protein A3D17_05220 [Bdellovibrionales bacterium RIFCSPHIGHO2_02_FULL_40_15]
MISHKIKILIVDDSLIIQKLLKNFLGKESDFEIIGVCADPFEASQFITEHKIDCMILDLELPKMDGVTFLKKVTQSCSVKTIILSGLIETDPSLKDRLISIGAFDAFAKPQGAGSEFFQRLNSSIRSAFARTHSKTISERTPSKNIDEVLLIASSTGGTDGVRKIVQSLGPTPPTVIIVQHMAAHFTKKFAASLDLVAQFHIDEINDHSVIEPHNGYVAPGNYHVSVHGHKDGRFTFELNQDPHIHAVRPAADHTFLTLPPALIKKATVIILTGMGRDGAAGLAHLKKHGARTIAESEKSAIVFGMPKAAIETGCVDQVLTLTEICEFLSEKFNKITDAAS